MEAQITKCNTSYGKWAVSYKFGGLDYKEFFFRKADAIQFVQQGCGHVAATFINPAGCMCRTTFTSSRIAEEWKRDTDHSSPGFISNWSTEFITGAA